MKRFELKSNLKFQFTLVVLAEIVLSIMAAFFLLGIFTAMSSDKILIPLTIWQILLSILIGGTMYNYINRLFFNPIARLGRAMSRVSDGDFSVKLENDSCIDEINKLYTNFNTMVQELNNTEILQSDFVSNVSHEFKTPINAIQGYAMLLQDDSCSDEERRTYTDKILVNTGRVSELVGNILLLSKLDNQSIMAKSSYFRLDEQIRQAVLLLEPQWSRKNIDFDAELDELMYKANEGILIHIWTNLIGNAIKFSPEKSCINISMKKAGNSVRVSVEDRGPGISDSDKKLIFNKFFQSDSSHTSEGNGLGLALVKRITDMYGGSIHVEDPEKGGSRFVVCLPL